MGLEVINVIYNGINYYTMFEIEESTLYHENQKFIVFTNKDKLLAYFSSQKVINNNMSYNLFCCYTSKEPIPTKYRIPNAYIIKLRRVFKKVERELGRFILDKIE